MKKFGKWFSFMMAMLIMICSGGSSYAMAEGPSPTVPPSDQPTGPLEGPGIGSKGPKTQGGSERQQQEMGNFEYYMTYVNPKIVELKLESCPIDQILRAARKVTPVNSIRVEYYSIGQRPISSTLTKKVDATSSGNKITLEVQNTTAFDMGDVIMAPDVMGYKDDGTTRSTIPLQFRVCDADTNNNPIVFAINGKNNASKGNRYDVPELAQGITLVRLGRAAGEREVETGSYYAMPEKSFQYCQRFLMQAEETIVERMHATEVKWDFTRQEKMAMDDMRYGMERSGLFGVRATCPSVKTPSGKPSGVIYTMGGIFWMPSKDLEIGHWQPKMEIDENGNKVAVTKTIKVPKSGVGADGQTEEKEVKVYEYVISEKDLTRFIAAILEDAGNTSRTKLLFVDNLIYQAFANLRSTKRIITQTEKDYMGWKLDFETFETMGTKILIYRHDSFNKWGMSGRAFCLDDRYLDKYVFGSWSRKEYNFKDLFISNSTGVVMEEYSCWTLSFPAAHARVARPAFDVKDAITDEQIAA